MTTVVDIINRSLQEIGTRTTITQSQLDNLSTNEAKQAALAYINVRDDILRRAPWACALNYMNLEYITSSPGTPENTSAATATWSRGQPAPPWLYEYQYPVDCIRACWIVPQIQTGTPTAVYPVATGLPAAFSSGVPVRFATGIDLFYPVTAAAVAVGGTGYAVGDVITLASTPDGDAPIGAPVQLTVATLSGSAVATVTINPVMADSTYGGSYFAAQTNPVEQGSTTGSGSGATFNLTFGAQAAQRVILTNQQNALLAYVHRVTDPNVMDPHFTSAWVSGLAAQLAIALTGDKGIANMCIKNANDDIMTARVSNGNEQLIVNDHTPDFIRTRGYYMQSPVAVGNFDWGGLLPTF